MKVNFRLTMLFVAAAVVVLVFSLQSSRVSAQTADTDNTDLTASAASAASQASQMDYNRQGKASIKITYPNGGENLSLNGQYKIRWESTNIPSSSTFYIEVRPYGPASLTVPVVKLAIVPSNSNSYVWRVPLDMKPGQYKIAIYKADRKGNIDLNESVKDINAIPFNILAPKPMNSIVVTAPKGGEVWYKGTKQIVSWDDTAFAVDGHDIKISPWYKALSCSAFTCAAASNIPAPLTIATGVKLLPYAWNVGEVNGTTLADGYYVVQVCQTNTTICAVGSSFTISSPINSNAVPVVSLVGSPTITKSILSTDQSGNTVTLFNATFNVNVLAMYGDISLDLPSSTNSAFNTFMPDFFAIYKNGAVDTTDYSLMVSYAQPTGTTLSADGKSFKMTQNQSITIPVTYTWTVRNTGANVYGGQVNGMIWSSATQLYQFYQLGGSAWKTSFAAKQPTSLVAAIWEAIDAYFKGGDN